MTAQTITEHKIVEAPQPFGSDKPVKELEAVKDLDLKAKISKVKESVLSHARQVLKETQITDIRPERPTKAAFKKAGLKTTLGDSCFMLVDPKTYDDPESQEGALVSIFITKAKSHPDLLVPIIVSHQRDDNLGRTIRAVVYNVYQQEYGLTPDQMAKPRILRRFNKICTAIANNKKKAVLAAATLGLGTWNAFNWPEYSQQKAQEAAAEQAAEQIAEHTLLFQSLHHFDKIIRLHQENNMSDEDLTALISHEQLTSVINALKNSDQQKRQQALGQLDYLAPFIFEKFNSPTSYPIVSTLRTRVETEQDPNLRHKISDTLFKLRKLWIQSYDYEL